MLRLPTPVRRRRRTAGSRSPAGGLLVALALPFVLAACDTKGAAESAVNAIWEGPNPDVLPKMTNTELPFRYPTALYAQKVQGNVTLRIFIDSVGRVHPESTVVLETSGYPALDSAAVRGSQELRFEPASKKGVPISVPILFPVFFRHPEASPLPGDTILRKAAPAAAGATRDSGR
jgi:TonB family protein